VDIRPAFWTIHEGVRIGMSDEEAHLGGLADCVEGRTLEFRNFLAKSAVVRNIVAAKYYQILYLWYVLQVALFMDAS
jgi:hypothetical protein